MDIKQIERIATWVMVACALLGTLWYIAIELQTKEGEWSAVGWSIIAVVWFVVYRRLLHQWRTRNKNETDPQP